eukprot:192697-Pelagomonas_calceolata.AAC.2
MQQYPVQILCQAKASNKLSLLALCQGRLKGYKCALFAEHEAGKTKQHEELLQSHRRRLEDTALTYLTPGKTRAVERACHAPKASTISHAATSVLMQLQCTV